MTTSYQFLPWLSQSTSRALGMTMIYFPLDIECGSNDDLLSWLSQSNFKGLGHDNDIFSILCFSFSVKRGIIIKILLVSCYVAK